jgi:hypothetical protein
VKPVIELSAVRAGPLSRSTPSSNLRMTRPTHRIPLRERAVVEKTARAIVAATIKAYVLLTAASARPYRSLQDRKEDR